MSVAKALGEIANEKGFGNELKVVEALQESPTKPKWIHEVRKATQEEDAQGVDVVVTTDVGPLFLQVKSSHLGAEIFKQNNRKKKIGVLVVKARDLPSKVANKAIGQLCRLRASVRAR